MAGSSWGPPTGFAIFYFLGHWSINMVNNHKSVVSRKENYISAR